MNSDLYCRQEKPWEDVPQCDYCGFEPDYKITDTLVCSSCLSDLQENEPCSKCGCLGCSECGKPPQDCSLNESLICPCCEKLTKDDFTVAELEQVERNIEKSLGGNLAFDNDRERVR